MHLIDSRITKMPDGLRFERDVFFLRCNNFKKLANGCFMGVDFIAVDCLNLELPEEFWVGKDALFKSCPAIKKVPDSGCVGRNLYLVDCGIEEG